MSRNWTTHTTETVYPNGLISHESCPFGGMYGSDQLIIDQTSNYEHKLTKAAGGYRIKEFSENWHGNKYGNKAKVPENSTDTTYNLIENYACYSFKE